MCMHMVTYMVQPASSVAAAAKKLDHELVLLYFDGMNGGLANLHQNKICVLAHICFHYN